MSAALKVVEKAETDPSNKGRTIVEMPTKIKPKGLAPTELDSLIAKTGERWTFRDGPGSALYLRVSDKGKKQWHVVYRVAGAGVNGTRGPSKRMALGNYPGVSLKKARQDALSAIEKAEEGIDPAAHRDGQRTAQKEAQETKTFEAVFRRWVEVYVKQQTKDGRAARARAELIEQATVDGTLAKLKGPKKAGRCAAERLIEDYALPVWGNRMIDTIRRAEALDLVIDEVLGDEGVSTARELRKHLVGLFNWAIERELLEKASPFAGWSKQSLEALKYSSRERALSMDELRRVWDAAGELGYPFGDWTRLLILTAQRRSEIAMLRRDWVKVLPMGRKKKTGDWVMLDRLGRERHKDDYVVGVTPAEHYKTGVTQVYPLSAPAWAIVSAIPRWNGGDYMLTSTGGDSYISGFSKAKLRLDAKIAERDAKTRAEGKAVPPMDHWTWHDLRRTVSTRMASELRIPSDHRERVLGHMQSGMKKVYDQYDYFDEKLEALEAWGALWK